MKVRVPGFLVAVAVVAFSHPLFAHHGAALYDNSKVLSMKATITEWDWANPHCFLKFDTKGEKGDVAHWAAESPNPADLSNRGWSKQMFKPGDQITVELYPVKNGAPVGRLVRVILANGQALSTSGQVQ